MISVNEFKEWVILQHKNTNHFYDKNLPYEFHLQMVISEVTRFCHLIELTPGNVSLSDIQKAAWGHDLIEDCRVNYNDVIQIAGKGVANIIYALTNPKGKNRKERNNQEYYKGINEVPGAAFIKICDRIANVKYGVFTNSNMVVKYHQENPYFKENIYQSYYQSMFDKLDKLFELHLNI